jgi:ribose transport system permease protein
VGRAIYAIRNGERAAYLAGLPTSPLIFSAFVFAGAFNGLGGCLLAGYANQAYQAMGDPFLLPAIAAIVVGGTNIQGGRGSLVTVMLATIFMTLLTSLLSVLQIADSRRQIIYGTVILTMLVLYGRFTPDRSGRS